MILITRPEEEAKKLAEMLERQGFECMAEPMIKIKYLKPDWENILKSPVQSFISTSKNSRKFLPAGQVLAAIPEQGKDAQELANWIIKNLTPEKGKLVYLRGDVISFDMAKTLTGKGFAVEEKIVYESQAPEVFSQNFLYNYHLLELATFFSTRSLENFLTLIRQNKMEGKLKKLRILCMSEEISAAAYGHKFAKIYIADAPNLAAMIEKIDEVY